MSKARKIEAVLGGLAGGASGLMLGKSLYKPKEPAGVIGELSKKDKARKYKYKGVGSTLGLIAGGFAAPRLAKARIAKLIKQDKQLAKQLYDDTFTGVKSRLDKLSIDGPSKRDAQVLQRRSDLLRPLVSKGMGADRSSKEQLAIERLKNIRKGKLFGGSAGLGKTEIMKNIFGKGPMGSNVEETLNLRYDKPVRSYIESLML